MRISKSCIAFLCLAGSLALASPVAKKLEKKSISNHLAPKSFDSELDSKAIGDDAILGAEDGGSNHNRAKKQASTTFCVEIKHNKPVQVECNPNSNQQIVLPQQVYVQPQQQQVYVQPPPQQVFVQPTPAPTPAPTTEPPTTTAAPTPAPSPPPPQVIVLPPQQAPQPPPPQQQIMYQHSQPAPPPPQQIVVPQPQYVQPAPQPKPMYIPPPQPRPQFIVPQQAPQHKPFLLPQSPPLPPPRPQVVMPPPQPKPMMIPQPAPQQIMIPHPAPPPPPQPIVIPQPPPQQIMYQQPAIPQPPPQQIIYQQPAIPQPPPQQVVYQQPQQPCQPEIKAFTYQPPPQVHYAATGNCATHGQVPQIQTSGVLPQAPVSYGQPVPQLGQHPGPHGIHCTCNTLQPLMSALGRDAATVDANNQAIAQKFLNDIAQNNMGAPMYANPMVAQPSAGYMMTPMAAGNLGDSFYKGPSNLGFRFGRDDEEKTKSESIPQPQMEAQSEDMTLSPIEEPTEIPETINLEEKPRVERFIMNENDSINAVEDQE